MTEEGNQSGMQEFQRRLPFVEKKISEINPEDIRIGVVGTVVDKKDNVIVVDDGTGKITANFETPITFEAGTIVRVFGRVLPIEGGFEIQGEIIQDMSKLDMELYNKVKEEWDKFIKSI